MLVSAAKAWPLHWWRALYEQDGLSLPSCIILLPFGSHTDNWLHRGISALVFWQLSAL